MRHGPFSQRAIRTTPEEQIPHALQLGNAFLKQHQDRIAELKLQLEEALKQLAERDYILLAILHGSDRLHEELDNKAWPDRLYADTLARLKGLCDEDVERRAER